MAQILDLNGNPIETKALREPQTSQLGAVAREYDLHPARGLTPATLHTLLTSAEQGEWTRQLDLADDMEERDGHLFAEIDKRKGAVAGLKWSLVEPEGADAGAKKLTAQLREWLATIEDFEDLVRGMMDAVLKSFSAHEMVWELQEGVLLPKISFRPQRWFTVDKAGRNELRLRTEANQHEGEALRSFAWIAHVHKTRNGYLARGGLVRVLAWPYLFKNYATRDLAEFLEIYGLPLRLGSYPSGATDEEKRRLLQAVTQIGHNAAGIIPQGMKIDFQSAAIGSGDPFGSMIDRMDEVESKAILGQTLSAGAAKNGTQEIATVHADVRMDIRNSDTRQLSATMKRQLLWPMAALNIPGADPKMLPNFEFEIAEPEDMAAYAENLPKLAAAGLKIPVKWAQDRLCIPEPEAGEEVMQGPKPPAAPPAPGDPQPGDTKPVPPKKKAALAARSNTGDPRDALDDLIDDATADWQPLLAPMVEPLLAELDKALSRGETLAAFRARLPELIERMDSRALGEQLARAAFSARLAGEADLDLSGEEQ
jgi:phage gp29-like protein